MREKIIRFLRVLLKALPHLVIILSGMIITFLVIDMFNSMMNFVNNNGTKTLMLILCVMAIIESALFVTLLRYKKK